MHRKLREAGVEAILQVPSRIADPYYIGYGSAAAHYGLTTQHRKSVIVVTPAHLRCRTVGEGQVRIVNPAPQKFFGFGPADVLGYTVTTGGFVQMNIMDRNIRTLSSQESLVVLALAEEKRRDVGRAEIIELLGVKPKAADKVIDRVSPPKGLVRKGELGRIHRYSARARAGCPGRE